MIPHDSTGKVSSGHTAMVKNKEKKNQKPLLQFQQSERYLKWRWGCLHVRLELQIFQQQDCANYNDLSQRFDSTVTGIVVHFYA